MSVTVRLPFDSTTNKDLLKTGSLRKVFDNTIHEVKSEYPVLFNDQTTDQFQVRDLRKAGLEEAVEITESQNIPVSAPVLDIVKEYEQREFGCGFRMSFKYDYFNKYSEWKRYVADMARLQKYIKETDPSRDIAWLNPNTLGTADEEITTVLDVSNFVELKIHAAQHHRSQRSPFTILPQDLMREVLCKDFWLRIEPHWDGGEVETDMFAGL